MPVSRTGAAVNDMGVSGTALPCEENPTPAAQPGVPSSNTRADSAQDSAANIEADSIKATRWSAKNHTVRLVHVCMELKAEFLARDECLDRRALDGAARDSFWQLAAKKFADPSFNPPLHPGGALPGEKSLFESNLKGGLRASWSSHPVDALKLKKEFQATRSSLNTAMGRFRSSGMGDMAEADKIRESNTVYSSTFENFCNGNAVAFYMYTVLVEHGCLESVTCAMPEGTTDSSSAPSRHTRGPLPEHLQSGINQRRSAKRKAATDFSAEMAAAFSQPVSIARSQAGQAIEVLKAKRMQLQLERDLSKKSREKEDEMMEVLQRMEFMRQRHMTVPSFMQMKLDRLQSELESFEKQALNRSDPNFDFFPRAAGGAAGTSSNTPAAAANTSCGTPAATPSTAFRSNPRNYDAARDDVLDIEGNDSDGGIDIDMNPEDYEDDDEQAGEADNDDVHVDM
eukprot:3982727-Pleurochrysis_carterae.AAC.1